MLWRVKGDVHPGFDLHLLITQEGKHERSLWYLTCCRVKVIDDFSHPRWGSAHAFIHICESFSACSAVFEKGRLAAYFNTRGLTGERGDHYITMWGNVAANEGLCSANTTLYQIKDAHFAVLTNYNELECNFHFFVEKKIPNWNLVLNDF